MRPWVYVVTQAMQRYSHLQPKGSNFISQFFWDPDYFPGHRIEPSTSHPAVKDSTSPAMVNRVRVSLDSLNVV